MNFRKVLFGLALFLIQTFTTFADDMNEREFNVTSFLNSNAVVDDKVYLRACSESKVQSNFEFF